jgi:hypothetical protein
MGTGYEMGRFLQLGRGKTIRTGASGCFQFRRVQWSSPALLPGELGAIQVTCQMNEKNRKNVTVLSAVIGGSAIVAMGALTMAVGQEQVGPDTLAKSTTMSVGATSTESTPPTVEATSMAVPAMKGPAPLPSEQKAAE